MWPDNILEGLGDKKSHLEFRARIKKLPAAYREASLAPEQHLINSGSSFDSAAMSSPPPL